MWCPWDLGLGPPGVWRVARPPAARLLCPGAPALFRPGPGGLPAAGGPAGPQTRLFPPAGPRGDQGQGLRHLGGHVGRKVPPAAGEQRDRCGCSLYIGVQERATQMLVGAVDIVGQVPANRLGDLARDIRNDLVVEFRLDCVAGFARVDPGADVLPNAVGVRQYRWRAFAHRGGQVALLAEPSRGGG